VDPLPRTPERMLRTIRLCLALGQSMSPAQGLAGGRVEEVYERARKLSDESSDPVQLFQALLGLVGTYTAHGRLDRAREATQHLELVLPVIPLPPFVFVGSFAIATVKYHTGDLREARQRLERALSIADVPLPPLSIDVHAAALGYLALVLVHQGHA